MKTKWLFLTMLIGCGGLFAVLSFGLTLAYLACNNNIVLFQSALPEILDVFRELIELLAWALALTLISYASIFGSTKKTTIRLLILLSGLLLVRRIFDLCVILLVNHKISLYEDLFYNLFYWIFDLVLLLISWLLISSTVKSYLRKRTVIGKARAIFGADTDLSVSTKEVYPFQKFFSKTNPLQRCFFKIALLFSASKLLSRLIFDLGYGAPESFGEVLIMFVYYLSDLIFGVIFYLFCILIFRIIVSKSQKKTDDIK